MSISYTETILSRSIAVCPQITVLQALKNSRTFKVLEAQIQGLSRTNEMGGARIFAVWGAAWGHSQGHRGQKERHISLAVAI